MNTTTLIIYMALGALLLLMVIIVVAILSLFSATDPELSETEIRLKKVANQAASDATKKNNSAWVDSVVNNAASKKQPPLTRLMMYWPERWGLRAIFLQAGLEISFEKFVQYFMAFPIVVFAVLTFLTRSPFFFLGLVCFPAGSAGLLFLRKMKRLKRIQEQLPDSLNMMTSALRAGHSFQSAIHLLGEEVAEPIGGEFKVMNNDLNLGLPVKDSMQKLIDHINTPDVRMFSTAVLIQREAGGNLAEVLDSLSYTIRERFKLRRQISALTSQARLSAYIMGAAPFVVFIIMFLFMNSYVEILYTNPLGIAAMVLAFIMQLLGAFIMYKIVSIKI